MTIFAAGLLYASNVAKRYCDYLYIYIDTCARGVPNNEEKKYDECFIRAYMLVRKLMSEGMSIHPFMKMQAIKSGALCLRACMANDWYKKNRYSMYKACIKNMGRLTR